MGRAAVGGGHVSVISASEVNPRTPVASSPSVGIGTGASTIAVLLMTTLNALVDWVGTVLGAEEALHEPGSSTLAMPSGSTHVVPTVCEFLRGIEGH